MKYYVETKKEGEAIRKEIRKLADKSECIAESAIIELFGHVPAPETKTHFYISEDIKKKMRLRETKSGWFLYMPELYFTDDRTYSWSTGEPIREENEEEKSYAALLSDSIYGRPCLVLSKLKKDKKRKEEGLCLGLHDLEFTKADGTHIAYPIFVVTMKDGSNRQVKPENVVFTDIR